MYSKLPPEFGEPPAKVIFDGVEPGSDAAQRLYHEHMAEIGHFHQKARQNRTISGADNASMQQAQPNGDRFRYTFNNGIETIHVKLTPHVQRSAGKPEVKVGEPWDYALIELAVPDMTRTGAVFCAYVQPEKGDLRGVAKDDHGGITFSDDPYLIYAPGDKPILNTAASAVLYSSLKVDLTGLRGQSSLKIDLFGYIRVYSDPGDPVLVGSALTAFTGREKLGYLSPLIGYALDLGDRAGYSLVDPWSSVQAMFPELATYKEVSPTNLYHDVELTSIYYGFYNGVTPGVKWETQNISEIFGLNVTPTDILTEFLPNDSVLASGFTETSPGVVDPDPIRTYWDAAQTILRSKTQNGSLWKPTFSPTGVWTSGPAVPNPGSGNRVTIFAAFFGEYYRPIYEIPEVPQYISRVAKLSTLMFRGSDPLDAASEFETPSVANQCFRWEGDAIYPSRWRMNVEKLGVPMHTLDAPGVATIENHFGMPRLGTVTIDIEHGAVGWKPA